MKPHFFIPLTGREWAGVVEANNKNIIFAKYVQNWTIMRLLIFHLLPSYPKISHCTQGHGNNLVLDLLTQLHFSCTSVTYVLLGELGKRASNIAPKPFFLRKFFFW